VGQAGWCSALTRFFASWLRRYWKGDELRLGKYWLLQQSVFLSVLLGEHLCRCQSKRHLCRCQSKRQGLSGDNDEPSR
jgi:hypothetical protein